MLTRVGDVLRREVGPREFWRQFGTLVLRARRAGRGYLLWEEWTRVVELADEHGLFAYFQGGREKTPRHESTIEADAFLHGVGAPAVFFMLRRVRDARARGLSPWQFHLEEERRIDAERARGAAIVNAESARRASTIAAAARTAAPRRR